MTSGVYRALDCREELRLDMVQPSSPFWNDIAGQGSQAVAAHDDTDQAIAYASQMRSAHEFPPLTASLTIPWLSLAYQVGVRISAINGRNISLAVNSGSEQDEPNSYPFLVSVTWDFRGDRQATIVQLCDRRSEPRLREVRHSGRTHGAVAP
jgi:hypothetical protein